MKVLMVNTPHSPKLRGGDSVQMERTAEALRQTGVEVTISIAPDPDPRGFDIAHVFNLRTIDATERQVNSLTRHGIPIVMSPIYLDVSLALWGSAAVAQIFTESHSQEERAELLEKLRTRTLDIHQRNGTTLTPRGVNRARPDYDERQRWILGSVKRLLPNSAMEMSAVMKTLRVTSIPFTIVPYGADAALFLNADPAPFIERFHIKDFVLQVGRLEPAKNQAMLCYAMQSLDLPLVLIGHPGHGAYASACRELLPKDSLIIGHVPQQQLASAYAAARVHALPSWVETCGLVSMEAALADCSLVVSTAGFECEYYRGFAYYCDPRDAESIRQSVESAYRNYDRDSERRRRLRSLILRDYTWEAAARITSAAYEQTLMVG